MHRGVNEKPAIAVDRRLFFYEGLFLSGRASAQAQAGQGERRSLAERGGY